VRVSVLCPGLTHSEFHEVAGASGIRTLPAFAWQSADAVARAGLEGLAAGKVVIVPGAFNRAVVLVNGLVPARLVRRAAGVIQRWRGAATSS
jgi:hypothetical protein